MDCIICGSWFTSTIHDEACPTCSRAIKRIGINMTPNRLIELARAEKDGRLVVLPPNDPLTLEELRGMDGEPVWIVPMRGSGGFCTWMLIDAEYELCREAHGEMAVFENCGKTWLAYRHKTETMKGRIGGQNGT